MQRPWLPLRRVGKFYRSSMWSLLCGGTVLFTSLPANSEDVKNDAGTVIDQSEISPKGHPPSLQKPADNPQIFLWQEGDDTWRVRVRTQKKKRDFTGTIKVHGGKLVNIFDFSGLEAGKQKKGKGSEDFGKWNAERDQIDFKFQTHGGEDGFAFKVDAKVESVMFDLKTDNAYHADQIHIGLKEKHPPRVPFTLSNSRPKPAEESK
ncbi:MAG TPA: hypothetical protein VGM98_23430 [Schlesneria sp.]